MRNLKIGAAETTSREDGRGCQWQAEPPNEWQDYSFEYSEVDDSAFQGNHRGMRSIIGTEFGENILNAAFDRIFRDGKLGGDLLIRISSRYQSKYFNLSGRRRVLPSVFGERIGGVSGEGPFARMNCPDRGEQFLSVCGGAGSKCWKFEELEIRSVIPCVDRAGR